MDGVYIRYRGIRPCLEGVKVSTKWLIGLATIFVLASVIVNIIEYNAPLGSPVPVEVDGELVCTSATCRLNEAIEAFNRVTTGDLAQIWPALGKFMTAFGYMLIWDYNFLGGGWQILRWGVLFPISLGLIFSVASVLVGLLGSIVGAIGGVVGRFRGI